MGDDQLAAQLERESARRLARSERRHQDVLNQQPQREAAGRAGHRVVRRYPALDHRGPVLSQLVSGIMGKGRRRSGSLFPCSCTHASIVAPLLYHVEHQLLGCDRRCLLKMQEPAQAGFQGLHSQRR